MLENVLSLEQKQLMSANQIQSLEILAYTNQELENFLTTEYLENPMLENTEDKQTDMIKDLEQHYEKGTSYKDHYIEWDDEDCNRRNDIQAANENEISDFLLGQLHRRDYTEQDWTLFEKLILCLDQDGFFTYTISDVATFLGTSEEKINDCLTVLKDLEPVGIFSADIAECLKKQLEVMEEDDEKLHLIIDEYLPDILNGRIGAVSRSLNLTTAQVKEYIHFIGSLNPRPIMSIHSTNVQYVVPDILVTFEENTWQVKINDNWMGEYRFNDYYIRMMQQSTDPELTAYFRQKLERARFIVNCVEQRRSTITKVVEAILEAQADYFHNGGPLKPMSMDDIAQKADIHVSTVSRALKDKYLQYKKTIFIKDLFTAASGQSDLSVNAVKERLKVIIENEDAKKPYSDLKIAELMQNEGITISRRTVTKYRKQLQIPESRQRLYL